MLWLFQFHPSPLGFLWLYKLLSQLIDWAKDLHSPPLKVLFYLRSLQHNQDEQWNHIWSNSKNHSLCSPFEHKSDKSRVGLMKFYFKKEWVRWRGCLWRTTLSLCGNESQLLSIQKPAHWLGIRTLIRHTIISPYTTFSNQTGPTHRNQNYTKGKTCLVCMYKDLLPYSRHIAWVLTITMGSSFH